MRTPVLTHTSQQDPHLTEAMADGLAALLIQEWKSRHVQHDQRVGDRTVKTPSGLNRADYEEG